ncbi:Z-ring associated protein ZapG [Vibrio vulnificus]|uniref:Z-ring associated protein ZapG n=1 Tax=Vibrio vulnificus TaxID=672 RepID=UPI00287A4341|nr:Z-ring associated protein ZapG [Vibrio vulnificus]MDS1869798.1 Z-ring associated protein ZapG [Vibrio vulnificus]
MSWMYAIVGLLVGAIVGVVVSRLTTPEYKKQKNIKKELDVAKYELEQQRQELIDHFSQTAELLETLGKDYSKLYQHMAKTSAELLPNLPAQDNPFDKVALSAKEDNTEENVTDEVTEQPKDYANGATGLFNDQKKVILDAPEAITAKAS